MHVENKLISSLTMDMNNIMSALIPRPMSGWGPSTSTQDIEYSSRSHAFSVMSMDILSTADLRLLDFMIPQPIEKNRFAGGLILQTNKNFSSDN